MKRILFALTLLAVALPAMAQQQTLLGGNIYHHGGYGGPVIATTQIGPNSDTAVLVGGHGGWLINHQFIIGGGGYGVVNTIDVDWQETPVPMQMQLGYGGIYLGYIRNPNTLTHFMVDALIGWGGAGIHDKDWENTEEDDMYASDAFFVLEPGVHLELNVTDFFRVMVGATYRHIEGADVAGLTDENLSGLSGKLTFKFGSF